MTGLNTRDGTAVLQLSSTGPGQLRVGGELDLPSGPVLASCITELLADADCGSVGSNLSAVHFIDCAGLGVLLPE